MAARPRPSTRPGLRSPPTPLGHPGAAVPVTPPPPPPPGSRAPATPPRGGQPQPSGPRSSRGDD
eukprot:1287345-Karenia_brevis.AAC.1